MSWNTAEAHALLFGIRRSVRYHDRRVAHFELLHRATSFTTVLLAGIVIVDLLAKPDLFAIKAFAAFAAILGAVDLIVGFSRRAGEHRDFKQRFIALEQRMIRRDASDSVDGIRLDRLTIEAEEPPVFRALDGLCHNELLVAQGYSRDDPDEARHFKRIPTHKRLTAHLLKWPDLAARTRP
jgi:hypothetical protein